MSWTLQGNVKGAAGAAAPLGTLVWSDDFTTDRTSTDYDAANVSVTGGVCASTSTGAQTLATKTAKLRVRDCTLEAQINVTGAFGGTGGSFQLSILTPALGTDLVQVDWNAANTGVLRITDGVSGTFVDRGQRNGTDVVTAAIGTYWMRFIRRGGWAFVALYTTDPNLGGLPAAYNFGDLSTHFNGGSGGDVALVVRAGLTLPAGAGTANFDNFRVYV